MLQITSTEEVPIAIRTSSEEVEEAIDAAADLINEPALLDSEYARGQIELIATMGQWSVVIHRGGGSALSPTYLRLADPDEVREAIRECILEQITQKGVK